MARLRDGEAETNRIRIGKIVGVSGLKGELKLFHDSGERERLVGVKTLFFLRGVDSFRADDEGFTTERVLSIRYHGKTPVLKIAGIETRDDAERYIGVFVYVDRNALAPLEEDSYFVEDIVGFSVVDEAGKTLGRISGVLDNPAHDILRIAPMTPEEVLAEDSARDSTHAAEAKNEILLPMVDVFVRNVDTEARRVVVRLPAGLVEND
jgi:16S rRNA processing protein RimM